MRKVPLCIPFLDNKEAEAVAEVLKSGWLAHGPKNEEFEEKFAHLVGTKCAVSMNSCASALFVALKAYGITGEVIVPSFTFVASVNAIVNAGAKPVFADIEWSTGNIDASKLESLITKKTQAIMPVHYGGLSADMNAIMKLARKHKLIVIEDSAEAIGAKFGNKMTGAIGHVGCFSFFATKNLTTGEGGMLTTSDKKIATFAREYIGHGVSSSTFQREKLTKPWLRAATSAGYNFRMSNILAAIGVVQMEKLSEMNKLRESHAEYLNKKLANLNLEIPITPKGRTHVWQMYTIRVDAKKRDKLVLALREKGIGASVHFDPPVHTHPFYKKVRHVPLNVTEKLANSIITLPMYPAMTKADLDYIVETLKELV